MPNNDPGPTVPSAGGPILSVAPFRWDGSAWTAATGGTGAGASATGSANFTSTAAAYGAGDTVDVAKEFALAGVSSGALIRILSAEFKQDVASVPAGVTTYTLHLYTVTPPSAQADNAVWTLASGDLAFYCGSINLGTPVDLGGALYVRALGVDTDVRLTGTSLWGVLVTAGAHTAAAGARTVQLHSVVL